MILAVLLGSSLVWSLIIVAGAAAAAAPEYLSSFGPDGTAASEFEKAGSVAIDQQSGTIYVLDHAGLLYKFDSEGKPLNFSGSAPYISGNTISVPVTGCDACVQVAVDSVSHDVYVTSESSVKAFQADGEPAEFTVGPGAGTNSIEEINGLSGVAVDSNGTIYASASTIFSGVVRVYAHSGEELTEFSLEGAGNIAVNGHGDLYVVRTQPNGVFKYTPSEYPVSSATTYTAATQSIDSNHARTVAVDPATNDIYVGEAAPDPVVIRYDESGNLLAAFAGPDEEGEVAEPLGIAIFGATGRVFVADGPYKVTGLPSRVEIFGFIPGPPTIGSTSVAKVTGDSATLRAKINPNSFETSYRFEYGLGDCASSACTSIPLGGADIGAGQESVLVAQDITGLVPGATYHFRVVAESSAGTTIGPDRTFMTQSGGSGFELADGRAWEMVSPVQKHGALLEGSLPGLVQASAKGEALTVPSLGSIESDPEGSRPIEPASVLARRMPGGGWRSQDITPPSDEVAGVPVGNQGQYKLFSTDLERAVLEPATPTALSPGGAVESPYLRENTEPPVFTSLVKAELIPEESLSTNHPKVAAATPDLSHIVLRSKVPLVSEAPPTPASSLYVWTAGQLQPISVLPAAEGGTMIATEAVGSKGTLRHAISDDGSRVFWSAENETALYLRDTEAEETVRLDVVQPGASGSGPANPVFQGANAAGTVVYFTDTQQLTEGASPEGDDLYRCQIPAGSVLNGCASLTDVSAPRTGSGENAEVKRLITGMSEDGSTVYFVSSAVLDEEPNGAGSTAVRAKPNLYLWTEGDGARFIATLSRKDDTDWGAVQRESAYQLSASTSPNGRYLAFVSRLSLAGNENLDAEGGGPTAQVFRYDAENDRLDCISCDPSGAAPKGMIGGFGTAAGVLKLVDPREQWDGKRVAALLPEPSIAQVLVNAVLYSPRVVLDNGRAFFNSFDGLVPSDSNGQWDVYQYEPIGVGDCGLSSGGPAIVRSAGGCISLISSGTGEEEAGFLDASATGNDAFFLTPARLNEPDEDSEYDVYDARVDGVPATLPSHAECVGEACQPLPAAPTAPIPASATFEGAGNLKHRAKRCRSGKRRVRRHGKVVCVRAHSKRHHERGAHGRGGRR